MSALKYIARSMLCRTYTYMALNKHMALYGTTDVLQ